MEEWKLIPSLPDYEASSEGRIRRWRGATRNLPPDGVLATQPQNAGYRMASFSYRGHTYTRLVHRLVAEAFLGGCPEGKEVNHKNLDKTDNRRTNLEYVTRSENLKHSGSYRGERNGQAVLTPASVRRLRRDHKAGLGYKRLAKAYGVDPSTARSVVKRRTWAHIA